MGPQDSTLHSDIHRNHRQRDSPPRRLHHPPLHHGPKSPNHPLNIQLRLRRRLSPWTHSAHNPADQTIILISTPWREKRMGIGLLRMELHRRIHRAFSHHLRRDRAKPIKRADCFAIAATSVVTSMRPNASVHSLLPCRCRSSVPDIVPSKRRKVQTGLLHYR